MKSHCFWLVLVLAACGSKSSSPATTVPSDQAAAADDPSCPLLVPGTSISVESSEMGAALVFVTTGDPLAVRSRAARLAEMYTKQDGPPNAMGMMFSKGMTATAMEIEGGARVEFAAIERTAVAGVQKELQMHASHLTGGTSPALPATGRCTAT
jgi:hypothetical protein